MKTSKKFISVILALLLLFTFVACNQVQDNTSSTEKETVKIAYLPITHALPVLVETELQKDNPNINIELVKYGSWAELMDALNTGRVDGASVLIELAMKAKEQGIDLKAVALGHKDGNVVIVKNEIQNIEDLKGKTFAIPNKQSSHNILLNQMLEDAGLTVDDINVVELAPAEMPSALSQGQIDGYCVAEPFGAKSVALDIGHVLYESGELWEDSTCCALVLTNDFIENKNEIAKEFVQKYGEAGKYITQNSDEAKKIAEQYLSVDEDVLEISLKWISYDDLAITQTAYDELAEKVKKLALSTNPPTYSDFVDATLLDE